MSTAKSFVQEAAERAKLEGLTDQQLLRLAARELLIAVLPDREGGLEPSGRHPEQAGGGGLADEGARRLFPGPPALRSVKSGHCSHIDSKKTMWPEPESNLDHCRWVHGSPERCATIQSYQAATLANRSNGARWR
jgi:hypothetical protein